MPRDNDWSEFIPPGVVELTNRDEVQPVELAGKWKHGYIPLDAAALESKMKGNTGGKKWWSGGTHAAPKKSSRRRMLTTKEVPSAKAGKRLTDAERQEHAGLKNRQAFSKKYPGVKPLSPAEEKRLGELNARYTKPGLKVQSDAEMRQRARTTQRELQKSHQREGISDQELEDLQTLRAKERYHRQGISKPLSPAERERLAQLKAKRKKANLPTRGGSSRGKA